MGRLARVALAAAWVVLGISTSKSFAGPRDLAVTGFAAEQTAKVRVSDPSAVARLQAAGGISVADYGAFSVLDVPVAALTAVGRSDSIEVLSDENTILLNAGPIDTTQAGAKALRKPVMPFLGQAMRLVQFAGPIQPDWYEALERTGVNVVTYIPSNAYLVRGDFTALTQLQALAAKMPQIQWDGEYLPVYRLDPVAATQIATNQVGENKDLWAVQLVADADGNKETLAVIDQLRSAPILSTEDVLNYRNVIVQIPPGNLATLALQSDIVSINPWYPLEKHDERQDQIIAGNLSGNVPSGAGYLVWLGTKGFTQAQFTASNFVVNVTDSGIDNGTTSPNHFGLYVSGVRPGTSRVAYNRLVGTPNSGSTLKGCDGHGCLNSHVIAGYNNLSGSPHADASGYRYGLGVCPFVKVGSSVIFDPNSYTNPNVTNLESMAFNDGARISSNSWGSIIGNNYNTQAQTYDALVRDSQPTGSTFATAGNQEMTIIFAAGNDGSGANTVRPPATAKNMITVGAAEGVQAFGGSDGCGTPDSQANSANDMATFSSRGPCSDNRKKPDIVAPGTHISGGVVQTASPSSTGTADACFDATGVCAGPGGSNYFPASGQQFYTASSGTSHSTPCVAGGAALVRQFLLNQGLSAPSPAMTKAMLMNSARYMTGTGANDTLWSNSQGMGEMNLGELFNRVAVTPTILRDQVAGDLFTASGQTRVFTGNIADNTKPYRVTLVWTDAPGATSGTASKNNLDLTVTIGANTYRGNVFSGANSTTGGSADTLNNVESVFLAAGVSGSFTVTVTATSINSDGVPNSGGALDQDFALVIYNGSTGGCPTIRSHRLPSQRARWGRP